MKRAIEFTETVSFLGEDRDVTITVIADDDEAEVMSVVLTREEEILEWGPSTGWSHSKRRHTAFVTNLLSREQERALEQRALESESTS